MNCDKYNDLIAFLALRELASPEKEELEAHLRDCPECRAEYESTVEVVRLFGTEEEGGLTDIEKMKLENDILRKLVEARGSSTRTSRRSAFLPALLRLAAAIIIFFAGYAAETVISQIDNGRQMALESPVKIIASSRVKQAYRSGLRFSSEGLKVIARGKSALAAEVENQVRP